VPLKIFSWAMLFFGVNKLLNMICLAYDKHKALSRINMVSLLLYVVLSLFLIKTYSYLGLSLAFFLTEVLMCSLMIIALGHTAARLSPLRSTIRVALACGVTCLAYSLVYDLGLAVRALVAVVTITLSIPLFGAIKKQDMEFFLKIARNP
jgi:O-antigen/teichoic acid export membrane protein